ncbi:FkbM family methyltransferase [Hyphomicrobium sp.]|uniref:FkbM family methyltransferase n=1 Tax=Hyphomicrobium sp. TaxID=82 RepID=UPI003F71A6CB
MVLSTATLPDGRSVQCVNAYEVDFSWHEIFADDLTAHGLSLPRDGVYVDVGANIGLFALHLNDLAPDARLIAYEPMPASFAALERNIDVMGGRAQAFQMALGAAQGELEFDYYPGISALSTANPAAGEVLSGGLKNLLFSNGASADVRAILDRSGASERMDDEEFIAELFRVERVRAAVDTLSNQASLHGLDRIDLVKIDTEGAEKDVLAGISETLWPRIRQMLVEVHLGRGETDAIAADLEARGYKTVIGNHPLAEGGAPVFHVYAARSA